jgi:ferredoxin-NADP reductase
MTLEEVERLGLIHATQAEMAAWFGVSLSTIEKRMAADGKFAEAYERGRATGRMSLRRQQLKIANEGNPTMLIWLGKQLLGQRDLQAMEVSGPAQGPMESTVRVVVEYGDDVADSAA